MTQTWCWNLDVVEVPTWRDNLGRHFAGKLVSKDEKDFLS